MARHGTARHGIMGVFSSVQRTSMTNQTHTLCSETLQEKNGEPLQEELETTLNLLHWKRGLAYGESILLVRLKDDHLVISLEIKALSNPKFNPWNDDFTKIALNWSILINIIIGNHIRDLQNGGTLSIPLN